jgi:hypothetical protein
MLIARRLTCKRLGGERGAVWNTVRALPPAFGAFPPRIGEIRTPFGAIRKALRITRHTSRTAWKSTRDRGDEFALSPAVRHPESDGRHLDGDGRHLDGTSPLEGGPLLDPPPLRGRGRQLPTGRYLRPAEVFGDGPRAPWIRSKVLRDGPQAPWTRPKVFRDGPELLRSVPRSLGTVPELLRSVLRSFGSVLSFLDPFQGLWGPSPNSSDPF